MSDIMDTIGEAFKTFALFLFLCGWFIWKILWLDHLYYFLISVTPPYWSQHPKRILALMILTYVVTIYTLLVGLMSGSKICKWLCIIFGSYIAFIIGICLLVLMVSGANNIWNGLLL